MKNGTEASVGEEERKKEGRKERKRKERARGEDRWHRCESERPRQKQEPDTEGASVPGDHHVFAVGLSPQALHGLQLHLGLGLPVQLHLVPQHADLTGQLVYGLGDAGA